MHTMPGNLNLRFKFTFLQLKSTAGDRPCSARQCELQFGNPDPRTLEKAGQGDLRRVVAFPLPEAGSRATRAAAHAPAAPQAPVSIHVLRDGRLVHTLPRAAPLKHSRAANLLTH